MIIVNQQICDLCGTCIGVCPVDAIVIERLNISINSDSCINCPACKYVCPVDALSENMSEQFFENPKG